MPHHPSPPKEATGIMKRTFVAALFALALLATPRNSSANIYDRDDSDHPLRYVAYVVYPVGIAVEYAILRPIHWFVSGPTTSKWFGHEPDAKKEAGTYFAW